MFRGSKPGFDVEKCKEVAQEIFRELWVRGPDREWHRYLVLPGSREILDNRDDPGSD